MIPQRLLGLALTGPCLLLATAAPAFASSALGSAQEPTPQASSPAPAGWGDFAARAGDTTLAWDELDRLLVSRHAMTEDGRAALKQLVRARLLDRLARESKLEIGPTEVAARLAEIEREVVAGGEATSMAAYLEKNGVDAQVFREFLRLGLVQERLARRALGVPDDRPVPGDQQEMWLDQVIEQRGTQMPTPPWPDGVAGRCGDLVVSERDYVLFLRTQVPADSVREACYQALLAKRVRARLPDLSDETLGQALDAEIARRRAEVATDPKYKGLSYEQILAAQGLSVASMRNDPAVVSPALAWLWVDRTQGEDGLRATYARERATFDGRYGESRQTRVVFLRAAMFENQLNPRTYERAEAMLGELAGKIQSAAQFLEAVQSRSEDVHSRDKEGLLGYVPRGDERYPAAVREAAFSGRGRAIEGGLLVGPVRLDNGAALLLIGERRAAPDWDEMRGYVHRELRRRFLEESLPRDAVVTYLDT